MTTTIDVFVFGGMENPAWESLQTAGKHLALIDVGSPTTEGSLLNELIKQSDSEYFAFVFGASENLDETLSQQSAGLQDHPNASVALSIDAHDDVMLWIWTALPTWLSVLSQEVSPDSSLLFRASAFESQNLFRELDAPIWDWMIRAAKASPDAIVITPANASEQSQKAGFPALAPARPGPHRDWLLESLRDVKPANTTLMAGLLQLHDYLDESHSYSQSIEGDRLGDHWHGIMHRREPDYSNAKYWYRRVGDSHIFPELTHKADRILNSCEDSTAQHERSRLGVPQAWDPMAFVDLCQKSAAHPDSHLSGAVREIQFWEMLLLLQSSYQAMSG